MHKITFLCALTLPLSWSKPNTSSLQVIQEINSEQISWKAETNCLDIKSRLGFLGLHPDPNYKIQTKQHKISRIISIPESFDAREKWPECKDVIGKIRNQGNCGSCWAFASTEVMTDRLCISSKDCGCGCKGGYIKNAWDYYINEGIASGGDYNSSEGCQPYSESSFQYAEASECVKACQNDKYDVNYDDDKHYGDSFYTLETNVAQIQMEILTNGPVMAYYNVFEDFACHKSGVYYYKSGKFVGRHSVKVIGWGTEEGIPYWLIANSWGSEWGELGGFFKMRRGTNECWIEQEMTAGKVHIEGNERTEEMTTNATSKAPSSGFRTKGPEFRGVLIATILLCQISIKCCLF
ncbi:cathepsin B-like cysteine proteinase 4 isoform X2 [Tribolium castaneum]|uniref:cathepsin B-like cysteine proteinase 4 isoform X2 n=1 Tax=Tribolium castaneum TaxID=7070 RepID=UPI0030FE7311